MAEYDSMGGAKPQPSIRKVPAQFKPIIKSAGHIGFGTDNNNQDSNKSPKPNGNAPDSHVCTPQGKPSA